MAVLDSILQHTALPQDNASEEIIPPMIGSLGCDTWMTASNYNASLTRKEVEIKQSGSAVNILSLSFAISSPVSLISPLGLIGYFFVACFDFSVHHPDFFVDISFYDSLERAQKRIKQASTCASMVKKVNLFFNKYILHERKYLSIQQSDADLLRRVQYEDSPLQNNGCDCGIFAVATTLHLAERIPLTSHLFLQTHVT
jgi:hypothetical protein